MAAASLLRVSSTGCTSKARVQGRRQSLRLPACPSRASRSSTLRVRAELQDPQQPLRNVSAAVDSFLKRYDVVSTGAGALLVTGYCVYAHGQDPFTALSITFTATIVALVANELFFSEH